MAEFDDLFDDLEVRGTVRFTLDKVFVRCDKPLVLVMRHAGDGNAEYQSGIVKLAKDLQAHSARGVDESANATTLSIYAHTVIQGWENCIGKDGAPLPYSPALGVEFLTAISKRAPDEVRAAFAYARNPDNFRGSPAAAAAALGK